MKKIKTTFLLTLVSFAGLSTPASANTPLLTIKPFNHAVENLENDAEQNLPGWCKAKAFKTRIEAVYYKQSYPRKKTRQKASKMLFACKGDEHYQTIYKTFQSVKRFSWLKWHRWDVKYKSFSRYTKNRLRSIRNCETKGMRNQYRANTGNGFYGAYQWMYSSWKSLVGGKTRPDLAPPREQDVRTAKLVLRGGTHHWPNCA